MIRKLFSFVMVVTMFLKSYGQQKLFTMQTFDKTGIDFINVIQDQVSINVIKYEYFYNGAGVAVGDINNDGLTDIYFSSNLYDCKLYLNQGNLKFKDITNDAGVKGEGGYKTGVVMVDINNDGWLDIYLCKSVTAEPKNRSNVLYINNKNGTFTNKAKEYGIDDMGFSMQAAFNDMDKDGDLDLLVMNHPFNLDFAKTIHLTYNKKNELEAVKDPPLPYESDRYYRNDNGKFIEITKQAGLETRSFGLSCILEDFNNDGLIDIYQANDYLEPDYLFINKGNNKFVNEFEKHFKHCSYSSMGSDYADINNDGFSDLITTDMLAEGNQRQKQLRRGNSYDEFDKVVKYGYGHQYVKNVLQLNNGNGTFSDISYYNDMAFSDWSWAVLINDFDNDGLKDVYIANGYMRDITDMDYAKFGIDSIKKEIYKTKNDDDILKILSLIPSVKVKKNYFKNYGNLNFKKESNESGLEHHAWSFGAAYADLDNDGDLEIIVNNVNDYAFIYKNNAVEKGLGNTLRLQLNGSEKNISAIGAKIEVFKNSQLLSTSTLNPMKGYLSSSDRTQIIGIGNNTTADVIITWPNGNIKTIKNIEANKLKTINYETDGTPKIVEPSKPYSINTIQVEGLKNYKHTENEYIDFKLEPLLPQRFSQLGPSIAVGDLNKDGLDDIFVTAAKDKTATLFLQTTSGFAESIQTVFEEDKKYEDGKAIIADVDNDGDNDIVVTSGGNDYPKNENMYPVRLYINDGKANFKKANVSQTIKTSSTCIAVDDYNKDGKEDIFIGGSTAPGNYGLLPQSFLATYENNSLTETKISESLSKVGMIKTAQWIDINNDSWKDLVLAGEWMPVTIFYNNKGQLSTQATTITNTNGWWNTIQYTDIDNDGDQDLIAGNLGMNTRYRGTSTQPVTMVVNDFDKNGSTDAVISVYTKDKTYPIAIRDYMLDQMPYLRKKYLRYAQYSTQRVEDIFTPEQLATATNYKADNMYSCIFVNDGKGNFIQKNLPAEAQLFPVNAIQCIKRGNKTDLLLVGNNYSTEVETGRCDAGIGLYLEQNNADDYNAIPVTQSNFFIPGDSKCMEKIKIQNKNCVIVGKNKDGLQVVEIKSR